MIDPKQITALLARIPTGTTPGPWATDVRVRVAGVVCPAEVDSPGLGADYAGVIATWGPSHLWNHEHRNDSGLSVWDVPAVTSANMELIALAPELKDAVVAMADEIEALRALLAECRPILTLYADTITHAASRPVAGELVARIDKAMEQA